MAAHELKAIADATKTALTTALAPLYTGIVIERSQFKHAYLPTFDHFAVVIAPAAMPWSTRTIGVRYFQNIYHFDLFALCKVTDEDLSLWGALGDATKGVFQLAEDIKATLRGNSLSSLLDRTFEEVNGDVALNQAAVSGFEAQERVMVHRAKVPYHPRTRPFCVQL